MKTLIAPNILLMCAADSCSSNPCQNGGACCNSGDSYYCQCPPGTVQPNCAKATSKYLTMVASVILDKFLCVVFSYVACVHVLLCDMFNNAVYVVMRYISVNAVDVVTRCIQ